MRKQFVDIDPAYLDVIEGLLDGLKAAFHEDFVLVTLSRILLQETIEGRWPAAMAIANARHLFATFDPVRTTSRGTSGNAILAVRVYDDANNFVVQNVALIDELDFVTFDIADARRGTRRGGPG